ncbi:MAG TPA: acyltransferase [Chthonomonadaceae bacterium]|nr:acyltransferase [Chthonomonadaceae bacterium]
MTVDNLLTSQTEVESAVIHAKSYPPREHFDYLDGVRALAALYVVADHARIHLVLPSGWTSRLTFWLQFGHFAVDVFIVLSGFCLMLPVARGDGTLRGGMKGFLARRARRILPPYYAAVALSLLLIWTLIGTPTGTHWDVSLPVSGRDILAHLLLVQDALPLVDGAKINHPLWSVAVEWQIYFLFPLLVSLWQRFGGARVAIVTTLLSYLAGVAAVRYALLEGMHFQYIGLFALGMLGATFAFSPLQAWKDQREHWPWGIIALGSLLLALGCGVVWRHVHGITIYVDPLIGVSTAALLVALAPPRQNLLKSLMQWKPLVFVGGFSYSLYLIHAPLLQVVWQYGIRPLHPKPVISFWLLLTVGTLLILLASYLFSLPCERPFITSLKREKRPVPATEEHGDQTTLTAPKG